MAEQRLGLTRLRLVAIVLPLAFLIAVDVARHRVFYSQLHSVPGTLAVYALLLVGVGAFSFVIFNFIARLQRQILERNEQLSALNEIASASSENLELDQLLNVALDKVLRAVRADAGIICLLDRETDELVAACYRGFSEDLARRVKRAPVRADPIGERVVRTGCPVVAENLLDYPEIADIARREGFRSAVSLPLKSDAQVNGVLGVVTRDERRFAPAELELLAGIGSQLGLAVRNAMLYTRVRQQNQELSALLTVSAAASSPGVGGMLDQALEAIMAVTRAEAAEIWLLAEQGELRRERQRGATEDAFGPVRLLHAGEGVPGLAVQTGQPVVVHDLASDARFAAHRAPQRGFQTFCALPLIRRGETLGVLAVAARDPEALGDRAALRLLTAIGEQVAVAIENARLHGRVLDVAVVEERERISRELHDGLAQVLAYINTQALAIHKLLDSGRVPEAQKEVRAIETTARELYSDVREAVLGLRSSLAPPGSLVPSLRAQIERYREMTGIAAGVSASAGALALQLPASMEIQLTRIVQEALSNVRRHADACSVRVDFTTEDGEFLLAVQDDGRGFDPERPARGGRPRFGLHTMAERAESIGGTLEITSAPGHGTRVLVRAPLPIRVEVPDARLAG